MDDNFRVGFAAWSGDAAVTAEALDGHKDPGGQRHALTVSVEGSAQAGMTSVKRPILDGGTDSRGSSFLTLSSPHGPPGLGHCRGARAKNTMPNGRGPM